MGEFRRTASRVWWSSFPEAGPARDREASSSPSSSHKSQDSGFSDSDHRSSPVLPRKVADSDRSDTPSPKCTTLSCSPIKLPRTKDAALSPRSKDTSLNVPRESNQAADTVTPSSLCLNRPFSPLAPNEAKTIEERTAQIPTSPFRCVDLSCSPVKLQRNLQETKECNITRGLLPTSPFKLIDLSSSPAKYQGEPQDVAISPKKVDLVQPQSPSRSSPNCIDVLCTPVKSHSSVQEATESPVQSQSPSFPNCINLSYSPVKFQKNVLGGKETPKRRPGESPTSFLDRSEFSLSPVKLQETPSLDLSAPPGLPAHTSTPKASAGRRTPNRGGLLFGRKHARPVNLLDNFNSNTKNTEETVEGPVQRWLLDLMAAYEPECTATLQSKSLAADLGRKVEAMAAAATDSVRALQERTRVISAEFAKLCRQLERGSVEHAGPLVQSLVGHISEFLQKHRPLEDQQPLLDACDRLRDSAACSEPDQQKLTTNITNLGHAFTRVVDQIMLHHITVLVGVLEDPGDELALRSALVSLAALGLEGSHLSRLVAACGGVRALLAVLIECRSSSVRSAALRALATVCCVADSIRQLEQAGGVEILSDLLSDPSRPEPEVSEAAAVLAQITAPWVEDNHSVQGLAEQLPALVQALSRLAGETKSDETLLLSAAALANLTFMEPRAVWPLLTCESAGTLLQAVRHRGSSASVFLQEQAATLLANMAAVPESRPQLAQQRAVVALLCFLQVRHSPLQQAPEIAAAERVQHKSAIALSRLSSDPEVARQVIELQGVARLVRLCKDERERNHSDGVLVACLAALRKIAANCGTKVIEDLDAMELVEPRLLDSFLIYSSRQESYV